MSLPGNLPANYVTGSTFTAANEDTVETDVNLINAAVPWTIRQTGAHQVPAARTYWANKTNTSTLPTTEDTGQTISSAPTAGVTGKIASGLLTFTPASGSGGSDLYYQWNAGAPVTRIGCRFILGYSTGTTFGGAIAMAMANDTINNIALGTFAIPVHLSLTSTVLQVTSYTEVSGFSSAYINYAFPTPLTIGTTIYECEMFLVGDVLTVLAPDGSVQTATQTVFNGAGQGNWGFVEPGMGVSNTDNVPGILEHWWDTSTTFVAPTAQLATTTMVNNTVYSPNSNILPAATNTYNLGGASNYWLYAFVLNYIGYNISLYNSTAGNYVGIASPSTASGTILTLPNANDTLVAKATTDILSNKRVKPRVSTASAPGATPSMNTDNYDLFEFTGLAAAITSMTTNLTGTPNDGDQLAIRFTDSGTARAITWGAKFLPSGTQALLATTVISKTHLVRFLWDATKAAWMCFYVDASGY